MSPRSAYCAKSGISSTTGGTISSAMLTESSRFWPRKRICAIAKAASPAASVETITAPNVMIAEFLSQMKKSPPCSASSKLPNESGQGNPSVSLRYCSSVLSAVISMNSSGPIASAVASTSTT